MAGEVFMYILVGNMRVLYAYERDCLSYGPYTVHSTCFLSEDDPNMADLYTRLYNSALE